MAPIKVAYLIDTIATDTEGTQKQLLQTVRRVDRNEIDPIIVCLRESAWMRQNELPCPSFVLDYDGFVSLKIVSVIRKLRKIVADECVDILQSFFVDSIFVSFLAYPLAGNAPKLVSSRRDIGLGKGNQPWYHALFEFALPFVNRRFSRIVANSSAVKSYTVATERVPDRKVVVIQNGVEVPAEPQEGVSLAGSKSTDTVVVVMSASLTPVKRHDLAISALKKLTDDKPAIAVRLVLLGDGPLRSEIERQIENLNLADKVHVAGAVANVFQYLLVADIGLLCSDREGLSNAILEYFAAGLPVIATDVGGNADLVEDDTGILVQPGDADGIAEAVAKLVDNPAECKRLGANARHVAVSRYSWPANILRLKSMYRKILGE